MKREHLGFFLFLFFLLIAPKVPLPSGFGAGRSTLSLGIIGLIGWAILSANYVAGWRFVLRTPAATQVVVFGAYALIVSSFAFAVTPIAYALQYFTYIGLVLPLTAGYMLATHRCGEFRTTIRVLAAIGVLFALGAVVSLWTGPLYPHQVQWSARQWGGLYIQQGVGFAENTNAAGAVLLWFSSLFISIWLASRRSPGGFVLLSTLGGLAATMSRSAVVAFALSLVLVLFVVLAGKLVIRSPFQRAMVWRVHSLALLAIATLTFMAFQGQRLRDEPLVNAVASGVGIGTRTVVNQDVDLRLQHWRTGWDRWIDGGPIVRLIGRGFRTNGTQNEYGVWETPHNAYLSVLGDFGLVGVVLLVVPFLRLAVSALGDTVTMSGSVAPLFAAITTTGLLLHNMTEAFLYSPVQLSLMLILLAHFYTARAATQSTAMSQDIEDPRALPSSRARVPAPLH